MKNVIFGLFVLGLTTQAFAQDPTVLPEVVIVHNYKYLDAANSKNLAIPVENLELKVSDFNVKDLDIYSEENDYYQVYFIIPKGKILATYDDKSNLLKTAERFTNIKLPLQVRQAVAKRFPQWEFTKNLYLVHYYQPSDIRKLYKITLENGEKKIRVKVDENGNFL